MPERARRQTPLDFYNMKAEPTAPEDPDDEIYIEHFSDSGNLYYDLVLGKLIVKQSDLLSGDSDTPQLGLFAQAKIPFYYIEMEPEPLDRYEKLEGKQKVDFENECQLVGIRNPADYEYRCIYNNPTVAEGKQVRPKSWNNSEWKEYKHLWIEQNFLGDDAEKERATKKDMMMPWYFANNKHANKENMRLRKVNDKSNTYKCYIFEFCVGCTNTFCLQKGGSHHAATNGLASFLQNQECELGTDCRNPTKHASKENPVELFWQYDTHSPDDWDDSPTNATQPKDRRMTQSTRGNKSTSASTHPKKKLRASKPPQFFFQRRPSGQIVWGMNANVANEDADLEQSVKSGTLCAPHVRLRVADSYEKLHKVLTMMKLG